MIEDSMVSDDWVDYDLDNHTNTANANNQNTDILSSENFDTIVNMPLEKKHDTANTGTKCSENPKKSTSESVDFDISLQSMNYNILNIYFKKLYQFLKSNSKKEMCLPYGSEQFEGIFKNIVQDIEVLRSQSLKNNCKEICDKIINTVDLNKSVFFLSYIYEQRKEYGVKRKILVIKKVYYTKEPVQKTSLSSSLESLLPSSKSSSEADPDELLKRSSTPDNLPKSLKTHCLRAALAFVKNKTQKEIEYPELEHNQADLMQQLLHNVVHSANFDIEFEIKDLYRALWESIKIHSLKYEFQIKSFDTLNGKKTLVFEKVVKQKPRESFFTTVNSDQIIEQKPQQIITKIPKGRMSKSQKKNLQNEVFINRLPRPFVFRALNDIIKFLSHETATRIVLAPKSLEEQKFYRYIINWVRMGMEPSDTEYKCLFDKISELLTQMKVRVPSSKKNVTNINTGIKEVTYIKRAKLVPPIEVPSTTQSISKKNKRKNSLNSDISSEKSVTILSKRVRKNKKIKLQDVINSDTAANTPITDLLNKSLRNKKKHKKRKCGHLETSKDTLTNIKVSSKIAFKPAENESDGNLKDPLDIDREAGLEGQKELPAVNVPKRSKEEVIESVRSSIATRSTGRSHREGQSLQRRERLLEALSVPVQIEKAMKMMRGMGWSGGALGARGNGITEPIMPSLERLTGAGLGHQKKKIKSIKKIEPKPNRTETKDPKSKASTVIGANWVSEESTEPTQAALETDVIMQKTKQLLQENISFDILINTPVIDIPHIKDFRMLILNYVLQFVSKDETEKLLKFNMALSKKHRNFVKHVNVALRGRFQLNLLQEDVKEIFSRILKKIDNLPDLVIQTSISKDHKVVELKKLKTSTFDQTEKNAAEKEKKSHWPETLATNADMMAFINALEPTYHSKRTFQAVKFRVLILLNILSFVRSKDEELEVSFNKVLPSKQKDYIMSTVESINSRLKVGNTPAELGLSVEIKNYMGDNFIGVLFNHQYTSFSLIKYSLLITSKKSAGLAQNKRKTSVNLDNFISDNSDDTNMATEEQTNNDHNILTEYNNNEVDDTVKKGNTSVHLINKEATDPKIACINEENDTIDQVTANNYAIAVDENANSQIIVKTTNINEEEDLDMHIEADCTNDVMIDKESVLASPHAEKYIGTDNENKDFETTDLTVTSKRRIDNQDYEETEVSDKIVDREALALENDNTVIVENNTEKCIDVKSMEIKQSHTGTSSINEDEVINLSDEEDIEEGSDGENAPMVGVDSDKQSEINSNDDVIMILEDDDDIGEESNTENVINTDEKMEMDDDVIKLDDDASESTSRKDSEDDTMNEINNEDELLQEVCIDETGKEIIHENDLIKVINESGPVTEYSERNQVLLREIDTIKESLLEMINTHESMRIINAEKSAEGAGFDVGAARVANDNKESNCDILINQTVDLSENNYNSEISEESDLKTVYIVPTNYPNENITREKAKHIQIYFSNNIVKGKELPKLTCHGYENGALIYSCHNKNTFEWVINAISAASDFKVLDFKDVRKLALKFYAILNIDVNYLFSMLEMYNMELSTKKWVVEKTENRDNYVIYIVKMDSRSINVINASNLCLFAGIDKVHFSIVWD